MLFLLLFFIIGGGWGYAFLIFVLISSIEGAMVLSRVIWIVWGVELWGACEEDGLQLVRLGSGSRPSLLACSFLSLLGQLLCLALVVVINKIVTFFSLRST